MRSGFVAKPRRGGSQRALRAFLDGDDLWSSNWLEKAHAFCGGA